jgi:hypothetical protein
MKKIYGFFGFLVISVGNLFRNGLGSPNEDSDTGLDYHPTPSDEEVRIAATKFNNSQIEDWEPLGLPS